MAMSRFQFAGTPAIHFGNGMLAKLGDMLPKETRHILFVTGSFARTNTASWETVTAALTAKQITYETAYIHQEPSAEWVDEVVEQYRSRNSLPFDAVVAIGGGSALDAGKAVSAMLRTEPGDTVLHYLEGLPDYRPHSGNKVFFIAVPTTSGTGSEMTKNAVLTVTGGFKRSIRHERFIPDIALVDAGLTLSCPLSVKAASGMDAITQLLESFVSTQSSPLTDALALSGLKSAAKSLLPICSYASEDIALHEQMAYASMISGITLAHAGLGLVHGFASPVGGLFPAPHGVICGTLLAEVTKRNIAHLNGQTKDALTETALAKYAEAGAILTGHPANDDAGCRVQLVTALEAWTKQLKIPLLGQFGLNSGNIDAIIAAADNKQSPARLEQSIMREILLARI